MKIIEKNSIGRPCDIFAKSRFNEVVSQPAFLTQIYLSEYPVRQLSLRKFFNISLLESSE